MEMLRILLGHSSYNVTQNYLHIASQMLITGYDMYRIDNMFFNLALLNIKQVICYDFYSFYSFMYVFLLCWLLCCIYNI